MEQEVLSLCKGLTPENSSRLYSCFLYAKKHLSGIRRSDSNNYAHHGVKLATVLAEGLQNVSLFSVAILHDLPIHPEGKKLLESSPLNPNEREMVKEMFELRHLHIDSTTQDLDRMINSFIKTDGVTVLRMAPRLNDVRNIHLFNLKRRKEIARETLHMYSAIAGRLGMNTWRYEMEDLSFLVSHPFIAENLKKQFNEYRQLDLSCLRQTTRFLKNKLNEQKIQCTMEQRIKTLYSSYRKMVLKKRRFEDMTDRLAIRIITDTELDCYKALGVVHAFTHPIPGKLKDYIGTPKENGYQSIHTVIYPLPGVSQQPIEIQIRTHTMHQKCEFGTIAHAEYKNSLYTINLSPARVSLFKNLKSLKEEVRSPKEFATVLRKYFDENQIAIFDFENNLYHIKKPATALDFVCRVYPERYKKLREVRINGRIRPFDTPLNDGDVVNAKFGRVLVVNKKWVNGCLHSHSRLKIRGVV